MAGNPERQRRECVAAALQQCEGALVRYAARMLGDLHSAADVVQHAFLQLCDQDPLPADPKPWLFKVCHNRILDLLRHQRHSGQSQSADDRLAGPAPDPAELAERRDLGTWLHQLVDQLPTAQREVVLLWSQGFRYSEIADITNQTEGGVRIKAHRGLMRLREHAAVRALLRLDQANWQRSTTGLPR